MSVQIVCWLLEYRVSFFSSDDVAHIEEKYSIVEQVLLQFCFILSVQNNFNQYRQ